MENAGSQNTFVFLEITYTLSERWQLVNVKGPWSGGTRLVAAQSCSCVVCGS